MKKVTTWRLKGAALGAALAAAWVAPGSGVAPAAAQTDYPNRPVQVLLGFPAGGGADIIGRQFVTALQKVSGKSFIVVNKPGAASNVSITLAKDARPDGYTLVIGSSSAMVGAQFFFKDVKFDALRDFVPLGGFLEGAFVLIARNETPASTPKELFAWLKTQPRNRFGFSNQLTLLAGEYVKSVAGIEAERVGYKSAVEAYPDLMAGSLEYMVTDGTTASGMMRQKRFKGIALMGQERHPAMADVPTMRESGFEDSDFSIWMALWAQKGVDPAITAQLEKWVLAAGKDPEYGEQLRKAGNTPISQTGDEIRARLGREQARWAVLVKAAGVQPE